MVQLFCSVNYIIYLIVYIIKYLQHEKLFQILSYKLFVFKIYHIKYSIGVKNIITFVKKNKYYPKYGQVLSCFVDFVARSTMVYSEFNLDTYFKTYKFFY